MHFWWVCVLSFIRWSWWSWLCFFHGTILTSVCCPTTSHYRLQLEKYSMFLIGKRKTSREMQKIKPHSIQNKMTLQAKVTPRTKSRFDCGAPHLAQVLIFWHNSTWALEQASRLVEVMRGVQYLMAQSHDELDGAGDRSGKPTLPKTPQVIRPRMPWLKNNSDASKTVKCFSDTCSPLQRALSCWSNMIKHDWGRNDGNHLQYTSEVRLPGHHLPPSPPHTRLSRSQTSKSD